VSPSLVGRDLVGQTVDGMHRAGIRAIDASIQAWQPQRHSSGSGPLCPRCRRPGRAPARLLPDLSERRPPRRVHARGLCTRSSALSPGRAVGQTQRSFAPWGTGGCIAKIACGSFARSVATPSEGRLERSGVKRLQRVALCARCGLESRVKGSSVATRPSLRLAAAQPGHRILGPYAHGRWMSI